MKPEPLPPPTPSDEAQWVEGALVRSLSNELHARPSLYFDEPAHVFHPGR